MCEARSSYVEIEGAKVGRRGALLPLSRRVRSWTRLEKDIVAVDEKMTCREGFSFFVCKRRGMERASVFAME